MLHAVSSGPKCARTRERAHHAITLVLRGGTPVHAMLGALAIRPRARARGQRERPAQHAWRARCTRARVLSECARALAISSTLGRCSNVPLPCSSLRAPAFLVHMHPRAGRSAWAPISARRLACQSPIELAPLLRGSSRQWRVQTRAVGARRRQGFLGRPVAHHISRRAPASRADGGGCVNDGDACALARGAPRIRVDARGPACA